MGQSVAIYKYLVVVFVLIACHGIVITQGRRIKALRKNEDSSINGTVPPAKEKAGHSPATTNQHVNYDVFEDSSADQVNAHRPTTPGNSPGVGHRSSGEDNRDTKTKVHVALQNPPNVEDSLTEGSKTDFFRPANPSFNRGIGQGLHQGIKT